jgi:hypothetical protein
LDTPELLENIFDRLSVRDAYAVMETDRENYTVVAGLQERRFPRARTLQIPGFEEYALHSVDAHRGRPLLVLSKGTLPYATVGLVLKGAQVTVAFRLEGVTCILVYREGGRAVLLRYPPLGLEGVSWVLRRRHERFVSVDLSSGAWAPLAAQNAFDTTLVGYWAPDAPRYLSSNGVTFVVFESTNFTRPLVLSHVDVWDGATLHTINLASHGIPSFRAGTLVRADAGKLVVVRQGASPTFYVVDAQGAVDVKEAGARAENIKRALVVCGQQVAWGDSTTDWDARPLLLPGSLEGCMTRGSDALLVQRLVVPREEEAFGLAFHKVTRSGGVDADAFDKAFTDGTHLAPVLLEAEDRPLFDGPYCFVWKETELDVIEMAPPPRTNQ